MSSLCVSITTQRMLEISITLIAALISIIIIVYGVGKAFMHHHLKLLRPFLTIYYLTVFFWCLGIIGFTIYEGFVYFDTICVYFTTFNTIFGVLCGYVGYSSGLVGLYLLFLLRLKYNFINTRLQITKSTYYILIIAAIIQIIPIISGAYFYIINEWDIALPIDYFFKVWHTLCCLLLLILYVRNTYRCRLHSKETPKHVADDLTLNTKQSDHDHTIDISQDILIKLSIKYTICAFCAFLSSIIVSFLSFYRGFIVIDTFDLLALHVMLAVIDMTINLICLHLQFSYFDAQYLYYCHPLIKMCKMYVWNKLDQQKQNDSNAQQTSSPPDTLPKLQASVTTVDGSNTVDLVQLQGSITNIDNSSTVNMV